MNYTFGIPAELEHLFQSGDLIRRGALLIYRHGGGIAGHLQETGTVNSFNIGSGLLQSLFAPVTSAGGLISGIAGNIQNEQIKVQNRQLGQSVDMVRSVMDGVASDVGEVRSTLTAVASDMGAMRSTVTGVAADVGEMRSTLSGVASNMGQMQSSLGAMASLQNLTLATSVASIGVSAVGTVLVLQRLTRMREELGEIGSWIEEFREEWRRSELDAILGRALTYVDRVDNGTLRRDPGPVWRHAEEALHECFDAVFRRLDLLLSAREIPVDALRVMLDALATTGSTQIKALFLLDEPVAARKQAQDHVQKIMAHAMKMPPDRLMPRLQARDERREHAHETGARLIETGYRFASIPALVNSLSASGISTKDFLQIAQETTDDRIMFLPASPSHPVPSPA